VGSRVAQVGCGYRAIVGEQTDSGRDRRSPAIYRDAQGRVTTDPAQAVSGEITLPAGHGAPRRTRFFLEREELPWLPVSESAFLLWVLVLLFLVWMGIGVFLLLT
jgi:hypothetical protein